MKITQDNLCSFCRVMAEKIEHLFWHCTIMTEFCESIGSWLHETIQYSLNINKQTAFFVLPTIYCKHAYKLVSYFFYNVTIYENVE